MRRALGRKVGKLRHMAGEFQRQFNEAMREAELDDVKESLESVRTPRVSDPAQDTRMMSGRSGAGSGSVSTSI